MSDVVEEGTVTSKKRSVITISGTKYVSLPKKWLEILKWEGKEVKELIPVGNSAIIYCLSEKDAEEWKAVLEHLKKEAKLEEIEETEE